MFYGKPGSDDAGVLLPAKQMNSILEMKPENGFFHSPAGVSLLRYLDPNSSSECVKAAHPGSARFCFSGSMTIKSSGSAL